MKITNVDYKMLKMDIFQFFLLVTKIVSKLVFFFQTCLKIMILN